ncbi:FAD dependent oxidoreductase [Planctopirus limnophila DSM 3776]|uniref:FAD dependent oxidoreductase n=1 Tax=Planctopirus limnophila (strain ATCC 43296 / DSM 3776 / IFAM 1008 / Mu 290) TaxID=521674 RepID=D5SSQ3_PLAL2|nr:FAD-dependent oxidoreductase [Planctopirus limnophila]ADG68854.1 FAD dependent oxidoreductase [Planctopirus limnophila DSM 3776]
MSATIEAPAPSQQMTINRNPAKATTPVYVVGAGVVGAACAHYLAEAGCQVVLIDQGEFGRGCSHGNCGYVSPSHVLPLCRPGAISSSLWTLFQKNSPFKIRPRLDLQMWMWFLRFALRCNFKDMLNAGQARHAMLASSRRLYQELMEIGKLGDCDWEMKGLMFVHHNERHFEHFEKTNRLLTERFGVSADRLDRDELLKREPALKPVVAGAWYYDCDAHIRPDLLMKSWRKLLQQQGVEIREHCQFLDLEVQSKKITRLFTSRGDFPVDHVVFATGAWSRQLQKKLGVAIPIEPGKGYSITMPRPAICPSHSMIFEDHRVAVTPTKNEYRIGSTMEFAGYDNTLRPDRLSLLTEGAKFYLRDPQTEPIVERWYGWRPMSCDGVPIVGKLPRMDNAWLAAGHSMLGLSMATATGKLVAEMLAGSTPHIDPHPYRVHRF